MLSRENNQSRNGSICNKEKKEKKMKHAIFRKDSFQ